MSLSNLTKHYLEQRSKLNYAEMDVIECVFAELYKRCERDRIPTGNSEQALELEAALIKFLLDSREN